MGFATLCVTQRLYTSCARTVSSQSSEHISAVTGRQYGQRSRSVRHASARLTSSALSWRASLLPATPYIGVVNSGDPVRGCDFRSVGLRFHQSVELCRSPVLRCLPRPAINERTVQRHSLSTGSQTCRFSDFASRFERIVTRFLCVLCLLRRRRLRRGARSVGPELGARLQLWLFGDVVTMCSSLRN